MGKRMMIGGGGWGRTERELKRERQGRGGGVMAKPGPEAEAKAKSRRIRVHHQPTQAPDNTHDRWGWVLFSRPLPALQAAAKPIPAACGVAQRGDVLHNRRRTGALPASVRGRPGTAERPRRFAQAGQSQSATSQYCPAGAYDTC